LTGLNRYNVLKCVADDMDKFITFQLISGSK